MNKTLDKIDLFGREFNFRINNKPRHTTNCSNITTILFFIFCIILYSFYLKQFTLRNEHLKIQWINKLHEGDQPIKINSTNFHISFQLEYFNSTEKKWITYKDKNEFKEKYTLDAQKTIRYSSQNKSTHCILHSSISSLNYRKLFVWILPKFL